MRGLAKGTQCTLINPVLQLICRSGGFLTDLVSGTFQIDDIKDHAVAADAKVASTPFVIGTHRIGTGRYALLTGNTATWDVGTHRVTCTYKMDAAGRDYTQVIDFEVLDAVDWPAGTPYVGYLSTRDAYRDGYAKAAVTRQTLHRLISETSQRIEQWTGRWFEPRYVKLLKRGKQDSKMLLQQPIIGIEDIFAVWQTSSGQNTYQFEQYLYRVYNRHLDGWFETDDRRHPYIELVHVDGDVVKVGDFAWPYGSQNIEVRGVFGYTDPGFDPDDGRIHIGSQPVDLARATGALVARTVGDPKLTSLTTWNAGGIKSYRTRDQSVTFGGGGGGGSGGGGGGMSEPSGDPLIDNILAKYHGPWAVGAL